MYQEFKLSVTNPSGASSICTLDVKQVKEPVSRKTPRLGQISPLDMMAHTSPPLTSTASDVISDEVFSSIETDLDRVVR